MVRRLTTPVLLPLACVLGLTLGPPGSRAGFAEETLATDGGTGKEGPGQEIVPGRLLSGEWRKMDLLEALTLAESRNLDARRAQSRAQVAEGEASEARLNWVPTLTASAGLGRTDGQVQGSFGDFRDVEFRSASPLARLSLEVNPAAAWFAVSAASGRSKAALEQERAVRRLVLVRVAELYYELVRSRAEGEVARLAVEDARDLLRISEVLLRQGLGRGDDAERARAEVASAEKRLLEAERRSHVASIDLAAALDLDPRVTLVPAEGGIEENELISPTASLEEILRQAVESRPEVVAARREVEARRSDRRAVAAGLVEPDHRAVLPGRSHRGILRRPVGCRALRRVGDMEAVGLRVPAGRHVGTARR